MPLFTLIPLIPVPVARKIACIHNVKIPRHISKDELAGYFKNHNCINCNLYFTIFSVVPNKPDPSNVNRSQNRSTEASDVKKACMKEEISSSKSEINVPFPPPALDNKLTHKIIKNFCQDLQPKNFEESGCAVCGELVCNCYLSPLKHVKRMLHILEAPGVTRIERHDISKPIREFKGPVLDYRCNKVCIECRQNLRKGKVQNWLWHETCGLEQFQNLLSCCSSTPQLLLHSCWLWYEKNGISCCCFRVTHTKNIYCLATSD